VVGQLVVQRHLRSSIEDDSDGDVSGTVGVVQRTTEPEDGDHVLVLAGRGQQLIQRGPHVLVHAGRTTTDRGKGYRDQAQRSLRRLTTAL